MKQKQEKTVNFEDFEGRKYAIPIDRAEEAQILIDKMPGWMGMYVKEFDEKFGEYYCG
jgi:hypothetical protein